MTARVIISIIGLAALILALHMANLAAAYIAVIGWFLAVTAHAIEYKLNKLLDAQGIFVSDDEIKNAR